MHANNPTQNTVQITGYIGAAPQLREMGKGEYVANIAIYTKRSWRRGDQLVIQNDRLPLTAYGRLAYTASKLTKGQLVQFKARLKNDRWQDRVTGEWRYALRVVVTDFAAISRPASEQPEEPAEELPSEVAAEEPRTDEPLADEPAPEQPRTRHSRRRS
jgi:single-strand DNA-binding protein